MKYRREIDGLRALAVIPVMLFHAGSGMFSGGFVGVDVFFVISGYLITSVIVAEQNTGTFSLLNFYERRARRILPTLFLVLSVCIPLAWLWLRPHDLKDFSESLAAVSTFVSNILFWQQSGYFATTTELKPLLHTWSLAVEEQYYVLFPLFLMLTWKFGKKWIITSLVLIAITSLGLAQWGAFNQAEANFYLLPTRGWELLIGALIAFYILHANTSLENSPEETPSKQIAGLFGIGLVIYSVLFFDKATPFPSLYTLIPTLGAAFIILFASPQNIAGKLLGSKLFVGIGLISYSAYLWHQPLFAFARILCIQEPSKLVFLILILATLLLAYISWKYVETPFRDKQRFRRKEIFTFSLIASLVFISLGLVGHFSNGFENYYINHRLKEPYKSIYITLKDTGTEMYSDMGDNGACNFWSKTVTPEFTSRFEQCVKKHGKSTIILGDSHAMNIYNALYRAQYSPFVVGLSQGACRPHENHAYCQYNDFNAFTDKNSKDIQHVIFHQSGSYLLQDEKGQTDSDDLFISGKKYQVKIDNIQKVADYLNGLAEKNIPVTWLGPFTEARVDFKNHENFIHGYTMNDISIKVFDNLEKTLKQHMSSKKKQFDYVSLADILKIDRNFLKTNNCLTYRDRDHFSVCGELIVGEKIKTAFSKKPLKTY